ncbi:MAG: hypothetical protein Q7T55_01765 [Solirubrobacteraceae bacterium]|nr:hypothetical protein [Solirubrobacteraceae bacterium]
MRLRPLMVAFCLLLSMTAVTASPALAQDGLSDLEKALQEPSGGAAIGSPTTPGDTSETDDAQPPAITDPSTIAPPAGTSPAPEGGTVVPVPPAYLAPGQSASVQPVSGVASLSDPDLPLEPVRIAALVATILAALLLGVAALLRTLGLRTAIGPTPVVIAPPGRFSRLREKPGRIADDIRDFLRHSR